MAAASHVGQQARWVLALPLACAYVSLAYVANSDGDFDAFIRDHGRTYVAGSAEYTERKAQYQRHVALTEALNSVPGRSWTAGVNKLADRTEGELAALRGYSKDGRRASYARPTGAGRYGYSFLGVASYHTDLSTLPENFTWKGTLKAIDHVADQASCGSCWAQTASTLLRAHSELYHRDRTFSAQQLLSCAPNPKHCGGKGGCDGATARLGLEYALEVGVVPQQGWEYTSSEDACPEELVMPPEGAPRQRRGRFFNLQSIRQLAENKYAALITTLYTQGPVGIAFSATRNWNLYKEGVLSTCTRGSVINHAAVLVGYGVESKRWGYWTIQNSWGDQWGEGGFVRLQRFEEDDEEKYCGWDASPQEGSGCDGGPEKVWVCGSCGILYDSVVPEFLSEGEGLLARLGAKDGGDARRKKLAMDAR